jgi:hypothetical protein
MQTESASESRVETTKQRRNEKPHVGAIVHYVGDFCRLHIEAFITEVPDTAQPNRRRDDDRESHDVSLVAFQLTRGLLFLRNVPHNEDKTSGWHWPELE